LTAREIRLSRNIYFGELEYWCLADNHDNRLGKGEGEFIEVTVYGSIEPSGIGPDWDSRDFQKYYYVPCRGS